MADEATQVIVTSNQKGGVGKTTLTANLAACAAAAVPPVLPAPLAELIADSAQPDDDILDQYLPQVLAVSTDPQQSLTQWMDRVASSKRAEQKPMPLDYAQEHENPRVLQKLKTARQYRRIFVDSPGWIESGSHNDDEHRKREILTATLESADLVIVPLIPEAMAFEPTAYTIEQVIEPLGVPFIVVINNWDPRDGSGDLDDTRDWVERHRWPVANTVIRRYKLHTSAPAIGRTCTDYPRNQRGRDAHTDYLELSVELALRGRH